jgi:hypothetical protein
MRDDALERLVAKAKTAMLDNIEDDQEWERHTRMNAQTILKLLTDTLSATAEELFPDGVPVNKQTLDFKESGDHAIDCGKRELDEDNG